MVKGAKEVILFDPRNNHQLYETFLQQARFEVIKNHDSYELVRKGLLERKCLNSDKMNREYSNETTTGEKRDEIIFTAVLGKFTE